MNFWILAISALAIIVIPVILAIILRRRYRVPWLDFCVGILTFIAAQVVHLPLNKLLGQLGLLPSGISDGSQLVLVALILGLTAGLTEELARTVGYAIVRRARRFQDGVMMGLGHGGIEAMIIGVLLVAGAVSLSAVLESGSLPENLTPEQSASLERQIALISGTPAVALAPVVERLIALTLQVGLSVMVLQAFVRRNWLYLLGAILIHAVFDFVAVFASQELENIWVTEALLALFTIPLIYWILRLRPLGEADDVVNKTKISREISIFIASIKKELFFQWRTRRVLIVCAVFLLFGMISPLIARYTPQILSNLEGAEQFAELIPEPSIGDATGQYIKNMTQFGFILAILLGMGAVAGEREKGTAAMVLSKPLPRWTFLTSKYVAQAFVYILAISLAAVSAYFYTLVLFDSLDLIAYLLINVVLLAWLLVFAAVTLLGSTIGRTTAAAAGIALLVSVLILLAGSVPGYGALAPGGLVTWAGQLALGENGAPNAGALALSLVLILLALISAVAVFEEQEV